MLITTITLFSQEGKRIAITIDDLPTLSHSIIDSGEQRAYFRRILETLENYNIKATGFVVGMLIREHTKELLGEFINAGHVLGNHTQNHLDLNKVSCETFEEDIQRNQEILSDYQEKISYFRYPMLHRGNTEEKKTRILHFLAKNNYTVAPVTIDTDEAVYNVRYVKAFFAGNRDQADSIGREYLTHMLNKLKYFHIMAKEITGREISHIMLLHMNFINSYYLGELLEFMKNEKWRFITLEEALKDPVYLLRDKYTGKRGLSWLERISGNFE